MMAESLTARVARLEAEVASLKGSLIGIVNEAVSAMGFELLNSDAEVVADGNDHIQVPRLACGLVQ